MRAREAETLVGLTFDDGYKDFADTAVPVLEKFGFSATVFAVVGMLGEENRWEHTYSPRPQLKLLGVEELREVAARGMEVGSHSMTHPDLSGLEPEQLEKEIGKSRRILGEVLGEAVEGFCYPYGSYDAAVVRATRRAGYGYGCGLTIRVEDGLYDLPRIPVSDRDSPLRIRTKLKIYSRYSRVKRVLSGLGRLRSARRSLGPDLRDESPRLWAERCLLPGAVSTT